MRFAAVAAAVFALWHGSALAQTNWEPNEKWSVSPDGTKATVTGRTLVPASKKLNPAWWFQNDREPAPPAWYEPGNSQAQRKADWYLRNPLQNFGFYVAGVADRNYTVTDPSGHVTVAVPSDIGAQGCYFKTIVGAYPVPLYYTACSTPPFEWYAGWQPDGFFGFKFNITTAGAPSLFAPLHHKRKW